LIQAPPEFSDKHLINQTLAQIGVNNKISRVDFSSDFLEQLERSADFNVVSYVLGKFQSNSLESVSLTLKQAESQNHLIWFTNLELVLDTISSIECLAVRESQEKHLKVFLHWLKNLSLESQTAKVLLQSSDSNLVDRIQKYVQIQTHPRFYRIALGEFTQEYGEKLIHYLYDRNGVSTPEITQQIISQVGSSPELIQRVIQAVHSGQTLNNAITLLNLEPLRRLETLLINSPYNSTLWALLQQLVLEFERSGKIYIPYETVIYSSEAHSELKSVWNDLEGLLFLYEVPTDAILADNNAGKHSGWISASSVRSMRVIQQIVNSNDVKRFMWTALKKKSSTTKLYV